MNFIFLRSRYYRANDSSKKANARNNKLYCYRQTSSIIIPPIMPIINLAKVLWQILLWKEEADSMKYYSKEMNIFLTTLNKYWYGVTPFCSSFMQGAWFILDNKLSTLEWCWAKLWWKYSIEQTSLLLLSTGLISLSSKKFFLYFAYLAYYRRH